jgi:hypothetical protein
MDSNGVTSVKDFPQSGGQLQGRITESESH